MRERARKGRRCLMVEDSCEATFGSQKVLFPEEKELEGWQQVKERKNEKHVIIKHRSPTKPKNSESGPHPIK